MSLPPGIKEAFIGPLFENIIYGLYLSASIKCWRLFRKKKARDAKHIYLMTTSALMFILITIRCIIDTYRLIAAFNTPGLNYGQLNDTPGTVTNICLILVNIIADMFMIFRTFIVWNRRWTVIIIPVLLCITNIGQLTLCRIGVWTMTVTIRSVTTGDAALESLLPETILIFVAVTLATNLACTGLIAFRIIHAHLKLAGMGVRTSGKGRSQNLRILSVLVESAAIYTLILIPILICARVGTFTIYILLDMTAPTIGLVVSVFDVSISHLRNASNQFSFIIIAVSRGNGIGYQAVIPAPPEFHAANERSCDIGVPYRPSEELCNRTALGVQYSFSKQLFAVPEMQRCSNPTCIGTLFLSEMESDGPRQAVVGSYTFTFSSSLKRMKLTEYCTPRKLVFRTRRPALLEIWAPCCYDDVRVSTIRRAFTNSIVTYA
ncbi:hypothetical protein DFH08DRAFT_1089084 [Mycena albidolilacea]|uniref:Uncharacterized protein n=1 Tax=Mycena albidolilacea TaxID=1033008 RepID=A0AAD7E9J1_9AGAR|nr:hypothetical protein DFH08DRAFT_1089084 [Mycena albidolilacea]